MKNSKMKLKIILLILAIAGAVFSCIPSLYPLYHKKDLITDEKLDGFFGDPQGGGIIDLDSGEYWKFEQLRRETADKLEGDWKSYKSGFTYKLSIMESGIAEDFAVHLLKLGEDLYLDFLPVDFEIRHYFLEMHLAPAHIFAKVELTEEFLVLHFINLEWLQDLIEDDRIRISHLDLNDGRILLTAKTDEIQKFILKYGNDSTTFIDADTLPRLSSDQYAFFNDPENISLSE